MLQGAFKKLEVWGGCGGVVVLGCCCLGGNRGGPSNKQPKLTDEDATTYHGVISHRSDGGAALFK